jgi:hypothetical protein
MHGLYHTRHIVEYVPSFNITETALKVGFNDFFISANTLKKWKASLRPNIKIYSDKKYKKGGLFSIQSRPQILKLCYY